MTNRIIKEAFDRYFDCDVAGYDEYLLSQSSYSGLDEQGRLSPHYRDTMLFNYPLSGWAAAALKDLLVGRSSPLTELQQEVLARAGLVNEDLCLTKEGKYKAISLLPAKDQLSYLELTEKRFVVRRPQKKRYHIEPVILKCYERPGRLAVFDEGGMITAAVHTFYYASRRYIRDFAFPRSFYDYCKEMEWDYFHTITDLARRPYAMRLSEVQQMRYNVSADEYIAMGAQARGAIKYAIRNVAQHDYFEDLEYHARHHPKRIDRKPYLKFSLVPDIKKMWELLGEPAFRRLCEQVMTDRMYLGWPDLTVVDSGLFVPIEVKGPGDRLRYSQIQNIMWFKQNFLYYGKKQHIATVAFGRY